MFEPGGTRESGGGGCTKMSSGGGPTQREEGLRCQEAKERRRCLMDGDEKGSEEEVKGEERRVLQTEEIRRIFFGVV